MSDLNTAALNAWEHDNAKACEREESIRDAHPLQEFEAQAFERLCDPNDCFLQDIVDAMPDVVVQALVHFAGHKLQHGYGYGSDLLRHGDAMKVHRRIDDYLEQAEQDLQDKLVDDEMENPSGPEPEDV
jgi:hypothetical protein